MKRVVVGVDWGFTNPGVLLVGALDGDDRLYLIYEIYRTGELIGWWVKQALEIYRIYRPEVFVCDPSEPGHIEALRASGLPARAAVNDVRVGVQCVAARLQVKQDGLPRLCISRALNPDIDLSLERAKKPTGLLQEIGLYVWPKTSQGHALKEIPVAVDNHSLDALRYMCYYLDGKAPLPESEPGVDRFAPLRGALLEGGRGPAGLFPRRQPGAARVKRTRRW